MSYGQSSDAEESRHASETGKPTFWRVIDPTGTYEKLGAWLMCSNEVIAWFLKAELTGYTMKKKDNGWLFTVRIEKKGKKLVSFTAGASIADCAKGFALSLKHNTVNWKPDLY